MNRFVKIFVRASSLLLISHGIAACDFRFGG